MKIIPAIDILDGKLVRLEKGDYNNQKIYYENPFEAAKIFFDHDFKLIHVVDLSGSKEGRITVLNLLNKMKSQFQIKIQFGGGIRSVHDAMQLIDAGIDKIIIGSISVSNKPEFEKIIQKIGTERIIAAIDSEDEMIKIKGWTEISKLNLFDHIEYCFSAGVKSFLCTDIKKDGTLEGPNTKLYKKILTAFPAAKILASGGVSELDDLYKLRSLNLHAVVIGKAIYENKIKLEDLKNFAGKKNNSMS